MWGLIPQSGSDCGDSDSRQSQREVELNTALETALYENGKSTGTSFNEAKNNYLQAASNLAQAECEFLYQVQLLELLAGKE